MGGVAADLAGRRDVDRLALRQGDLGVVRVLAAQSGAKNQRRDSRTGGRQADYRGVRKTRGIVLAGSRGDDCRASRIEKGSQSGVLPSGSSVKPKFEEVVAALRSGWLTTGPRVKRFEQEFAAAVRAPHAVALNSCTAALHLAVHALGLRPGDGVLVPALTFAATAEVVRYEGGIPILVDCDPVTLNMDLEQAERTVAHPQVGRRAGWAAARSAGRRHDPGARRRDDDERRRHQCLCVDATISGWSKTRRTPFQPPGGGPEEPWQHCGQQTAAISCFSFYANKTITTGEGGMAVTADAELAARMRLLSLHGLSHDAWGRYSGNGSWDYRILAPGYKYNLTDIAAAIGIHQLARAEEMRRAREAIALEYRERLGDVDEIELPLDRHRSDPRVAPVSDPAAARRRWRSIATPSSRN